MRFEIDKEVQAQPVEWLRRSPEITQFLRDHGMNTVGEVISRQAELPPEYWLEIKKKLIFNI